ncbi:MAG: branched-chain amino acid transaminase [Anaerolineae bacterium]|nr:branched-chain amino acid transaminase [Anaerolineae bacterium]
MGVEQYIWMDGKLVEESKASMPFLNGAAHYGAAVFEGIRCYDTERGPAVFRLREHMERLVDSAVVFGFRSLPYSVDELCQATIDTVNANGLKECYIRPLIYAVNNMGLNLDAYKAAVGIAAWEWGAYLGAEARMAGVRANVSSFTRHHVNVTMTKAKVAGNYSNSMMAKTESVRLGFDEAIMLDPQGYVAECTGENLFLVRDGKLITSPTAPVLEGITRSSVIALAKDAGIEVLELPISRDQLYIADELFVCGSAAEVIAIREVDFRTIGAGKMGPVTQKIQQIYDAAIHGKHALSKGWLAYCK